MKKLLLYIFYNHYQIFNFNTKNIKFEIFINKYKILERQACITIYYKT